MTWFSRLSPIPSFPDYAGPFKVGTVDVELPVADLDSPVSRPDDRLNTISYRVFYPCDPDAPAGRPVRWVPQPQKQQMASSARLMGAGNAASSIGSYLLKAIYYVRIPARRNAALLRPTTSSTRWPTVVFSHGLSGTRNSYSYLLGSLASHGTVVFAPNHHDGSAPIAHNRASGSAEAHTTPYRQIQHKLSDEVSRERNEQLKVRLWELGLVHQAILKMDNGDKLTNLDTADGGDSALGMFKGSLDCHRPGAIAWTGHSFGAATVVQLVKSVFYRTSAASLDLEKSDALFTPPDSSAIAAQVTPSTAVALLDPWMLPLRAGSTAWLWNKPMPCYSSSSASNLSVGGNVLLTILSEAFYKWSDHLEATKRLVSASPATFATSPIPPSSVAQPRFFYMAASAHPSQSDFGIIFPWFLKTFFHAREPERLLQLNVRAILQLLREKGVEVAKSVAYDENENKVTIEDDAEILSPDAGVRGWVPVSLAAARKEERDEKLEGSTVPVGSPKMESAPVVEDVAA